MSGGGDELHLISTRGSIRMHSIVPSVVDMNITWIVLIAALVLYLLFRRMTGQMIEVRRTLVLPGVIAVIGLASIGSVGITPMAVAFVAFGVAVAAALGVLRGFTIKIEPRDGFAFMRYTVASVALLIASVAVRLVAAPIEASIDASAATVAGHALMLSLGVGFLAEGLVVLYRATRTGHAIAWQARKTGDHAVWRHGAARAA